MTTPMSLLSLASFGGLGLNTATCHHVGGLYNVPHGEANAILLPHTMRYNLDACADRQRLIAEAIGVDGINFVLNAGEVVSQEDVLGSLRLFASEVIPKFRSRESAASRVDAPTTLPEGIDPC